RLITAGCVLALGLLTPIQAAGEKAEDNLAVRKLNRDIPRHKEFLKRIEQSKGEGDVIFLGDSITHGWAGQKAWPEPFGSSKPVTLGISGAQTGHIPNKPPRLAGLNLTSAPRPSQCPKRAPSHRPQCVGLEHTKLLLAPGDHRACSSQMA